MTFLLKDPDAVLDYLIDWGAEYLSDDQLVQSTWSVSPEEPEGVTVIADSFDANTSTVQADGGVPGKIYRLINRVELASGRIDSRSMVLRVEQR